MTPRAMSRAVAILLVCLAALAGFVLGRASAPRSAHVDMPELPARDAAPVVGARALELARIKRVAVRVGSDDIVVGARRDVESSLRNRLAAAGFVVVPETEDHDVVLQARIEGFHFSAFDEFGAGSELHVVGVHAVEVDGKVRLIPHDLWQADAMRLARKERLDAEALALSEELLQHFLGAVDKAKSAR